MGILIAIIIIAAWTGHLAYILTSVPVDFTFPLFYVHVLVQTYLFTGLFITGHDAMHGTVAPGRKRINQVIGFSAVFLYAAMSYRRLLKYHRLHHQFPGTEQDPDFSPRSQNFWAWWARFMARYLTVWQLIIMAVIYNILKIWLPDGPILAFWVVPAILSTLQLFYFGTYIPHRRPHTEEMRPHNARTLRRNHLRAMLSCYFFGYHYEHHESPGTPWWRLYRMKHES
jgi:beta-carotene ketolase (CrtW type)